MGTSSETKKKPRAGFPKFLMSIDGKLKFMSMLEAGSNLGSWWTRVEVAGSVLEADYSVRSITAAERNKMSIFADQCDEEK